jgi:hypothetical protein
VANSRLTSHATSASLDEADVAFSMTMQPAEVLTFGLCNLQGCGVQVGPIAWPKLARQMQRTFHREEGQNSPMMDRRLVVAGAPEEPVRTRSSIENLPWLIGGVAFLALLLGVILHFRQEAGPAQQLAAKANRIDVVTRMQLGLASASEAENKKEVSNFAGVESIRRLPSGNTVLGANNGSGQATLQELDSQDAPVAGHNVTFTNYSQFRMLRRTPQGTFLIGVGAKLAEVNWDKQILWEMTIPDGDYVYQGLRLPDKTIAVTSGYGAALLIIDPAAKKVLTTIGGKGQPDATTIVPNFYAGYQVLPNGHFVVTNWEGHGGGNGGKGIQLLEYDPSGLLVWKWKQDPNLVSSIHHTIVLDGLDTTKLHDDINGVLAPVTQ